MEVRMDWSGARERVLAVGRAYDEFEPVLSQAQIAEVEARIGVELPEDYRSFLAQVGAGGPGPTQELMSLECVDGEWGWTGYPWRPDVSGPFVEGEDWAAEQVATLRAAGHQPGAPDEAEGYLADYREVFGADSGDEVWHRQRTRGAVLIGDSGCAMTTWLVLVGPHRGELRFRDCEVDPPFDPCLDPDGSPHTFGTWYLEWLAIRERHASGIPQGSDSGWPLRCGGFAAG
ncbi:SMI1/KNR4 family protein [Kitasatospora sp. NPDC101183]|uniref:SMI1/KNR4 family protein n=1 Tax=Kitasatospora sp. NPDC101183 TaxID=3364100 RepID=UPI0037FCDA36